MPPMHLFHGDADISAPCTMSVDLCESLQTAGVLCTLKLYAGQTHTDPIIEGPLSGGRDPLLSDIIKIIINGGTGIGDRTDLISPHMPVLANRALLSMAKFFNPF